MADPIAVANIDPMYEDRCRDFRDHAKTLSEELPVGGQIQWFRPEGWNGVPTDVLGFAAPFSSAQATTDYLNAIKDPVNPGTSGDVIVTTEMINTLATMERAFRVRHLLRRPRAVCHSTGRYRSQGSDLGVYIAGNVEVVRRILADSRVDT